VTLIDLLAPPANIQDNVLALLFIFDEQKGTGQFQFSAPGAAQQMVLSPDTHELLVRRYDGDEYVVTYDLESGQEVRRFLPALRAIGAYSRAGKNRVLAYDLSGEVIISDFQRLEAETNRILAEDLRYSRQFDRFFFSSDGQKIITLAGTEWREWSIQTGEVLRRDVVSMSGAIIATSPDGYRYLTHYPLTDGGGAAEVIDMNSGERSRCLQGIPAARWPIYASPS
jgi:WD40 repeat protein